METYIVGLMAFYFFYIIAIGLLMFTKRVRAVKNQQINPLFFKSYQGLEEIPRELKIIENHYNNQFQAPLLFFAACLTALALKAASLTFVVFALLFVISRLIHSFIHLGSNKIVRRAAAFFFGAFMIGFMWLNILLQL